MGQQNKATTKISQSHTDTFKIALGHCNYEQISTMLPHENEQSILKLL